MQPISRVSNLELELHSTDHCDYLVEVFMYIPNFFNAFSTSLVFRKHDYVFYSAVFFNTRKFEYFSTVCIILILWLERRRRMTFRRIGFVDRALTMR